LTLRRDAHGHRANRDDERSGGTSAAKSKSWTTPNATNARLASASPTTIAVALATEVQSALTADTRRALRTTERMTGSPPTRLPGTPSDTALPLREHYRQWVVSSRFPSARKCASACSDVRVAGQALRANERRSAVRGGWTEPLDVQAARFARPNVVSETEPAPCDDRSVNKEFLRRCCRIESVAVETVFVLRGLSLELTDQGARECQASVSQLPGHRRDC
jgi:hypothetical protein